MKRLFTLMMTAVTAVTVMATDYTDKLLVLVNGQGGEQDATISVTEHDGLYDLNLKNFILKDGSSFMPVGNVELTNITPLFDGGVVVLRANQQVAISEGDQEGVDSWMGPLLGQLPVELVATIDGDQLYALINLDLTETLGQVIEVRFNKTFIDGKGIQIPNGDFELWHTSTGSYEEPNAWHSFESATGDYASLAGHHISKSDKGRNGSTCARIYATSMLWGLVVANGTMTTGRMNAGATSASDKTNNAYIDMSLTDTDGNGDPFYVALNSRPDSLAVWLQFKQGKETSDHPYATVSAAITDGTYFQDPQDKEYTNIVATAANRKIEQTPKDEWVRFSMPFEYTENNVKPRALLITISTNADAGQGSANDEVLIDDISLIYNGGLASLNVEGFSPDKYDYTASKEMTLDEIKAVANAQGARVMKALVDDAQGKRAEITVLSADLKTCNVYTIDFPITDGIQSVPSGSRPAVTYNLNGQQVNSVKAGQVYLIRQPDGKVVKVSGRR